MLQDENVEGHWTLEDLKDEQREYRSKLAGILRKARSYRGTEVEYREIMEMLIDLEAWSAKHFGENNTPRLTDEEEKALQKFFHPTRSDRTITDLLNLIGIRFEKFLEKVSDMDIVTVVLEGIILPPGIGFGPGNGEGSGREIKFEPRFQELVALLHRNGIYLDDLIRCKGQVGQGMRRGESYSIVEIPRLNRQVLVCDQVGEATFVVNGMLPRTLLTTRTKEELLEIYHERISKIVKRNPEQWEKELQKALFEGKIGTKIDVKNVELLREAAMEEYPTPAVWVAQGVKAKKRRSVHVCGMGVTALATKFGVPGNPKDNLEDYYELGRRIYGDDPILELRKHTIDEVREDTKRQCPTARSWIELGFEQKCRFRALGMGLRALALKFGLDIKPLSTTAEYYELGKKIYGDDPALELREHTLDELRAEVKRLHPTSADWIAIDTIGRRKIEIFGVKLIALATKFGVAGNPLSSTKSYSLLGREIYGEDAVFVINRKPKKKFRMPTPLPSETEVRAIILTTIPTPVAWVNLPYDERVNLRILGMNLAVLASYFNMKGSPLHSVKLYRELGKRIFGDDPAFEVKEYTLDELTKEVKRQCKTPAEWMALTLEEAAIKIKPHGLGLGALGTRFGVEGNTYETRATYRELGKKIYGPNPAFEAKEYTLDELAKEVKCQCKTPAEWMALSLEEAAIKIKPHGLGLGALGTRFGVEGNTYETRAAYTELGKKIYGPDPAFEVKVYTIDDLKAEVIRQYPTFQDWMAIGTKAKRGIQIFDVKLTALSSRFGISGNPFASRQFHELGRKIYGNDPTNHAKIASENTFEPRA